MKPGRDFVGLAVGATIMNEKGELLLIKRKLNTDSNNVSVGKGNWSTVGGKVEFGESVIRAIKREINEEIGAESEIVKFIGYTEQIFEDKKTHWVMLHFLCNVTGDIRIMEPEKVCEIKWTPLNKLPKDIILEHVTRPLDLLGIKWNHDSDGG